MQQNDPKTDPRGILRFACAASYQRTEPMERRNLCNLCRCNGLLPTATTPPVYAHQYPIVKTTVVVGSTPSVFCYASGMTTSIIRLGEDQNLNSPLITTAGNTGTSTAPPVVGTVPPLVDRDRTAADRACLSALIDQHLEALRVRHYSPSTLRIRSHLLRAFCQWCATNEIRLAIQIGKSEITQFQTYLYDYRKTGLRVGENGQPLSIRGQQMRLCAVRVLFSWLTKNGYIPANPTTDMEMPREERRLPKHVLTHREVDDLLKRINTRHLVGLRDRAILETLYSTGIRRSELIGLQLHDLNREGGLLRVNQGKGRRDRVVPIGQQAVRWIDRYLAEARLRWVRDTNHQTLFLTTRSTALSENRTSQMVRHYVQQANLGKVGSCHLFRHTCATVLLQNGADIRHIQQILGHASLETTQIYAHVMITDIKRVHDRSHPTAHCTPAAQINTSP
jgi:integrase/recombinase XerD